MQQSKTERALALVRGNGVLRPRDLSPYGISRQALRNLCNRGDVTKVGRGLYVLAYADDITQHHSLAQASKQIPNGIICLLSALNFHELTTQTPSQVWMAIDEKAWHPELAATLVRTVRFSGTALKYGIEEHTFEHVNVLIYNPAKTVADCFKYRNKIGLDIAIEALRDCLRQRKATIDQIMEAATVCRVQKVIRPYLESLV